MTERTGADSAVPPHRVGTTLWISRGNIPAPAENPHWLLRLALAVHSAQQSAQGCQHSDDPDLKGGDLRRWAPSTVSTGATHATRSLVS